MTRGTEEDDSSRPRERRTMPTETPPPTVRHALDEARRQERLSHAEWRRRRAEVARLIAAGEEAAARRLLAEIGPAAPADAAKPQPTATASPQPKRPEPRGASPGSAAVKTPQPKRQAPALAPKPAAKSLPKASPLPRRLRRRARPKKTHTWREWFQNRPPWVTSLGLHGVSLTLFGLLTFTSLGDPGFRLIASLGDSEAWDDLPVEVSLADLATETPAELDSPTDAPELATESVELASLVEPVDLSAVSAVGDVLALSTQSLMAAVPASGDGEGDGEPAGGKPTEGGGSGGGKVSFFGAQADAERVVFVVDNSGSMREGRMETTLYELDNAVKHLSESQEFYVVFFSDQAYGMFFPEVASAPLRATRENKQRLHRWLHTVEMCIGGRLIDAMEVAAGFKPDVAYLLTDGDIRSPYVTERLTTEGNWEFTIHTLGMGARTPQHVAILEATAAATGGTYRPVGAHPGAVARSRQRPLPYHRTPGAVWGSAVQPWN